MLLLALLRHRSEIAQPGDDKWVPIDAVRVRLPSALPKSLDLRCSQDWIDARHTKA